MQQVTIIIKKGAVKVEGMKGESCQDLTRGLDEKLGAVISDEATEEMYEQPEQNLEIGH